MSESEWLDIFAANLKSDMERVGINQRELARKTGLSDATISTYLNRQRMPGIKAVLNISYALGIDASDLIDFDEMID